MCETMHDILIGIISGLISSAIISALFYRYEHRKEQNQGFDQNVQTFHRWIRRIRNEVELSYRLQDTTSLLRELEDEPIVPFFEKLSDESQAKKSTIMNFIHEIHEKAETTSFSEQQMKYYMGMLSKYSIDALHFQQIK